MVQVAISAPSSDWSGGGCRGKDKTSGPTKGALTGRQCQESVDILHGASAT